MSKPKAPQPNRPVEKNDSSQGADIPQRYRDAFARYDAEVEAIYKKGVEERKSLVETSSH